ncbi:class I SAM-dependent methyltransferase [Marinobacter zhanjiangensis]|uniref:Ribosomal RNA small subunit methyltransferase C n=1 Tax=Marinobacter zhanjiangensis TaxID=578215 RepID=A0ABQ3ATV3_9GAMM|nr:class I SAM-dependent methyltransferase [Marinobacter zhanjiangensis]GGY63981.1 ribosomal RNA small subunit methyltransferase C [Marinobacter zhanjiangensis]
MSDRRTGSNAVAALERNPELLAGRVGFIGLPGPDLPAGLDVDSGPPLVITEHAGLAGALEAAGHCRVSFGYGLPDQSRQSLDTVVLFVPKARQAVAMQLALAGALLAEDGRLVLVGEKREGIAGGARQLQALAENARKADSARHCQVWVARPEPGSRGFDPEEWLQWHDVDVAGVRIRVAGMPGIFSDGRLDEGTERLLESLADQPVSGPVLDFACGAGVIGSWLQERYPGLGPVDGVDVQAQAVMCARKTYECNGAGGEIFAADGVPAHLGRYGTIVTNPPFHSGVRTDTTMTERFLRDARRHLKPGGELRLVANRFLPYQPLLEQSVGNCRVLFEDRRFTIYQARVPS